MLGSVSASSTLLRGSLVHIRASQRLLCTSKPPPDKKKDKNLNVLRDLEPKSALDLEALKASAETSLKEQQSLLVDKWDEVKKGWKEDKEKELKVKKEGKDKDGQEWYTKRVSFWMKRYENFVGLTEVKSAQASVVEAEKRFIDKQEERREIQLQMSEVGSELKRIRGDLEKTSRGEERYLTLVTEEHNILRGERDLLSQFQHLEKGERESFSRLSNAVRDSHEKERAQAEKTKYWSVIGSVIGTCLGIIGTTINNRMRMRELRDLVTSSASGDRLLNITEELGESMQAHESSLKELVGQIQHAITDSKLSMTKIGEMQSVSEKMAASAQKFNISGLEDKTARLMGRSEDLYRSVVQQQKLLEQRFSTLANDIRSGQTATTALLTERHADLQDLVTQSTTRDASTQQSFANLYQNQTQILNVFQKDLRSADDKVAAVLKRMDTMQTSAEARRRKDRNLMEDLDETLVDKLENALKDHEARTKTMVFVGGVTVACATTALVYCVNKFL